MPVIRKVNFTVKALTVPVLIDLESCEIWNVASCPDEACGVISVEIAVSVRFFERPAIARHYLQIRA